MDQQAVSDLMDKWMNDDAFRAAVRNDPEGTIRKAGIVLNDEQWKAFREVDWSQSDEELAARTNNQQACSACC